METLRQLYWQSALAQAVPLLLTTCLAPAGVSADESVPHPSSLNPAAAVMAIPASQSGDMAVIGNVNILNGSIFDLEDPAENKALYRLANRAHITTRSQVVEQQLLFRPGDDFNTREIEESERILRANRYLQTVSIQPVPRGDGVVDVNVETTDTWTLMPKISLSRSGGKNNSAIGIKEMNLLGSGVAIEALLRSDVDRDYRALKVTDRNLGSSWYGLTGIVEDNSDGHTRALAIERPFYSLQSTSALGFSFYDSDASGSYYDAGDVTGQYRHQARQFEISGGWSKGLRDGWARRYTVGVAVDDHRFSAVDDPLYAATALPSDRRFAYPFVGVEFVQDKYETASNHDQINRTEDVFLGTRFSARMGLAGSSTTSNGNTWIFDAAAEAGFGSVASNALLLETSLKTRLEPDGVRNLLLSAAASYYRRQSDRRLFRAALNIDVGNNLDLDQYLQLGGDSGLRGYSLRYQTGDKRALLTLEQRYFTDWYPWRLFHVGGAVFLDVGRAWGDAPNGRSDDRLLKNVGAGLRIGSSRSGLGRMTHIDIAVPLDGGGDIKDLQFLVSTKKSF